MIIMANIGSNMTDNELLQILRTVERDLLDILVIVGYVGFMLSFIGVTFVCGCVLLLFISVIHCIYHE